MKHFNAIRFLLVGGFIYHPHKRDILLSGGRYDSWQIRIPDVSLLKGGIDESYYPNYSLSMFPDFYLPKETQSLPLLHLTHKELMNGKKWMGVTGQDLKAEIQYFDLYLFTSGIGLFTFCLNVNDPEQIRLNDLITYLSGLRVYDNQVDFCGEKKMMNELIRDLIHSDEILIHSWNQFGPNLKLYCLADIDSPDQPIPEILFCLGTFTVCGPTGLDPNMISEEFKSEVYEKRLIRIYRNWQALALNDTFSRISVNFKESFPVWEYNYMPIYLYALHAKFFMYYHNILLKNVSVVNRKTLRLKDDFIEFINDHNLLYISYKFLPNQLLQKMTESLGIEQESQLMENKIKRLNESYQTKRSNDINRLLIVLAFLSVFSVIKDFSEYLGYMGMGNEFLYGKGFSVLMGAGILGTVVWLFRKVLIH